MLLTRSPLIHGASTASSFDLHVLSTPPAFVLSQDQTLQTKKIQKTPNQPKKPAQENPNQKTTQKQKTGIKTNKHTIEFTNNTNTKPQPKKGQNQGRKPPPQPQPGRGDKRKYYPPTPPTSNWQGRSESQSHEFDNRQVALALTDQEQVSRKDVVLGEKLVLVLDLDVIDRGATGSNGTARSPTSLLKPCLH